MYCILRIAANVVLKDERQDVRSDDEEVEEQGSSRKHIKSGKQSLAATEAAVTQAMNGHAKRGGRVNGKALNGEQKKVR